MEKAITYVEANQQRIIDKLKEFLRFPSISTREEHRSDCLNCAEWIASELRAIGFPKVEIRPTQPPNGLPVVWAEWVIPDAPCLMFYGHYDVQPAEPLEEWITPAFQPEVRNGNIYARGAVDDKGQVWAFIQGIQAAVIENQGKPPVSIKVLIEGEEEIGSPNLGNYLQQNTKDLAADYAVICDTSQFAPGVPAITYGLRGIQTHQLTIHGPKEDLHSGQYGGVLQNPIKALTKILAGLHDDQGRVTIPGFYDGIDLPQAWERSMWKELPFDEHQYQKELGVTQLQGEAEYSTLERNWVRPTCEFNGITGGYTGSGFKTVIGKTAHAKVSFRLVPGQDPQKVSQNFQDYCRSLCPPGVTLTIESDAGGRGILISPDSIGMKKAKAAMEWGFGAPCFLIRCGASIPVVATFKQKLNMDSLLMGFGLPDDNLHAPNEKFNLTDFIRGIKTISYFIYHFKTR